MSGECKESVWTKQKPIKYYGIKFPTQDYILYIKNSVSNCWFEFFKNNGHRLPIDEAIKAYEAIGYKIVRLDIREIEEVKDDL